MLRTFSMIGLFLYFSILLFAVTREKKSQTVEDYFFAGRTLPFWALSITFIASWWGAGSAISTADLAYTDGLGAFWYYGVPVLVSTFLMILCAGLIRRVGYLTQGKMMEARYSKTTAKMLSVLIFLFMLLNAASQMVGIGLFFGTYLGLNYTTAILVGSTIVLIYSMFGGFRGVVLTDVIQFVLLLISAVILCVVSLHHAGGFTAIRSAAEQAGDLNFMSFTAGAHKYMMYVVTFGASWMIQANVWQRISATKTESDARKMTVMSFLAYIPLYLIVVFTGMAGRVLFDTLPEGGIISAVVTNYLSPVVGALVFIGISAAIMSTMDSLINTAAMTLTMDLWSNRGNDEERLRFSRLATLIVTVLALMVSLRIRSILDIAWLASDIITTGVFIPLIAGFIWKRGNASGALASMLWGLMYCLYNLAITYGVPLPHFWPSGSAQQVLLGVGVSTVLYTGVSLFTQGNLQKAEAFVAEKGGIPEL